MSDNRMVEWRWIDEPDTWQRATAAEFIGDNDCDPDVRSAVRRALREGIEVSIGGGAWAEALVRPARPLHSSAWPH